MTDEERSDAFRLGWEAIRADSRMDDEDHYVTDMAHVFFIRGYAAACAAKKSIIERHDTDDEASK